MSLTAPLAYPSQRLQELQETPVSLAQQLERDGIVVLPNFVAGEHLAGMQRVFAQRLQRQRWNDIDGYEQNEQYRLMVQHLLTLDQGFVDVALHPLIKATLRDYIGPGFELVEAKGWLSKPTRRDFHGWHGDMWYDQTKVDFIPRECKLGVYLTDVKSGAFKYIKGTHGKQAPRNFKPAEVPNVPPEQIVEVLAQAGTAVLFDTSGIHRQSVPILEPRQAFFYGYHDPTVPIQPEDVAYNRYHPLLLNAAFLGGLTKEDQRILGFGNKTNFQQVVSRKTTHRRWQWLIASCFSGKLVVEEWCGRISGRLRKLLGLKK
jgi:Phytanoyl-CoA dioxygenase (PhyH)